MFEGMTKDEVRSKMLEAAQTGRVIAAQDHNIIGGLGCLVAKVIAERSLAVKFKILGFRDKFVPMAHASYLYHEAGYDSEGLARHMMRMF